MKRIIGVLAVVALAAAVAGLAVSCTTSHTPEQHGRLTVTTGGAFETQTLHACAASTGYQIAFARGKWFVSAMASNSAVVWVKPHSAQDTSGTLVSADAGTNPVTTDAGVLNGWARLGDGQTVSYGIELANSAGETSPSADQIYFLDVWCETQGDLVVVGH